MPVTSESAPVDISELLQRGLDYFGRDCFEDAVRCWMKVLRHEPGHPDAIDYLQSAGVDTTGLLGESSIAESSDDHSYGPPSNVTQLGSNSSSQWVEELLDSIRPPPPSPDGVECKDVGVLDCEEIELLLSQRRYEEVLSLLYAARKRAPKDASLSRSIRHVRERLAREYAYRLVDLDRIPRPVPGRPWSALADADWSGSDGALAREARQLAGLVDGISSFADIVAASPLGQLSTLRGLCTLLEREYVVVGEMEAMAEQGVSGAVSQELPPSPISEQEPEVSTKNSNGEESSRDEAPEINPMNSGVAPRSSSLNAEEEEYAEIFRCATKAYLLRDFEQAVELFSECCRRRPDDRRAHHNLETLMRRMSKL